MQFLRSVCYNSFQVPHCLIRFFTNRPKSVILFYSEVFFSQPSFSEFPIFELYKKLLLREVLFTIRQDSLYVAVCMIACTSFEVTLPTRLAPCITATHRVWLHGSLAITVTGLTPASVVQLRWTHQTKKEPSKEGSTNLNMLMQPQ